MKITKSLVLLLLALAMAVPLAGYHSHTPGPEATCTTDQVCLDCGRVLVKALGHEPGAEPTCTQAQTCTRCGEVLAPALGHAPGEPATCVDPQICTRCGEMVRTALGHQVDDTGVCTVCFKQIVQSGQRYTPPGGHGQATSLPEGLVPETQNTDHYHNDIDAYYKSAVLICGDYGLEYFQPDPTGSSAYADVINAFADRYPNVNVTSLITPKCCAFESPEGYTDPYEDTKSFINSTYAMMRDRVKKADVMGVMTDHKGEYMFYRTDHHWTSLGAYYASVAYCNANGITPYALDTYETVINPDFVGTLHYFAGGPAELKRNPDYTVGHFPHTGYVMSCYSGGWYGATAIDPTTNTYASMYIGGDVPLTVFETDLQNNDKTLIVFKESYGNAFVPYMLDYYHRVVVVDIRKDTDSVASLMTRYGVTDALIINNAQAAISFCDTLRSKVLS